MGKYRRISIALKCLVLPGAALLTLLFFFGLDRGAALAHDPDECACESNAVITTTVVSSGTINWGNAERSRVPRNFQRTAAQGERGAGGIIEEGLCSSVLVTDPEAEVWVVTPDDRLVLNQPRHGEGYAERPVIEAIPCGGAPDTDTTLILTDPDGSRLPLTEEVVEDAESGEQITVYSYRFPSDSQTGGYRLEVNARGAELVKNYVLLDYLDDIFTGPLVSLFDPDTGQPSAEFIAGGTVGVSYRVRRFGDRPVEVGLYQVPDDVHFMNPAKLIDTWQVHIGDSGAYSQVLKIPQEIAGGTYWLAVSSLGYDGTLEPLMNANLLDLDGAFPADVGEYVHFHYQPFEILPTDDGEVLAGEITESHPAILNDTSYWVPILAGAFTMGSDRADIEATLAECNATEGNCQAAWFGGETPARSVFVDDFEITRFEITNIEYTICVEAGVCEPATAQIEEGLLDHSPDIFQPELPAVGVTWRQASQFCDWMGGRLPTEEEWEKAARGGDQRRYPWGDAFEPTLANLDTGYPSSGGTYPGDVSPYGVHDLAGNVVEWTASSGEAGYVLRGGGWNSYPFRGRVTDRGTQLAPDVASFDIGFRCARD